MTGPSSTPRGERTPRAGITWAAELVRVERVVADDEPDPPTSNRATRRAMARERRQKGH